MSELVVNLEPVISLAIAATPADSDGEKALDPFLAPAIAPQMERWSYEGLQALHLLNRSRQLYRCLAQRTTTLVTENDSVTTHLASVNPASLPQWSKLPPVERRPVGIQQVMMGARIAALAFDGELTPEDWFSQDLGDDTCCICVSLGEEAATRFLERNGGEVGKFLRKILSERLGSLLGSTAMAATWVRPHGEPKALLIFIVLRAQSRALLQAKYRVDVERRFYRRILQHGVPHAPDGMPLKFKPEDFAGYLGLTAQEWQDATNPLLHLDPKTEIDAGEYIPGKGFLSAVELETSCEKSFQRWKDTAAKYGIPYWMQPKVLQLVHDLLVAPPGAVTERKRLAARNKKHWSYKEKLSRQEVVHLDVLTYVHNPLNRVRLFRGTPAQLAAMIYDSGEVIGDYTQSEFKAGRAKALYERLRDGTR